jgi:catechol 2,3-dioxygenase-like lactoylglutathione lyase family enzyme
MTLSRLLVGVAVALATMTASAQHASPKLPDCAMTLSEFSAVQPTGGAGGSGNAKARVVKDRLLGGAAPPREGQSPGVGNAVTESVAAASGDAFRIKSVDHTGFTVSSLEDSLEFWVDVMGFRHLYTWTFETGPFIEGVVGVPGAAVRLAMVEAPGHMIELLEYTSPPDRQTYRPRSSDVGSVHIAFHVENIDALLARIASFGRLPVGNIQTVESGERKGLRLIYVRGPDGITIEFLQLPEDAPK